MNNESSRRMDRSDSVKPISDRSTKRRQQVNIRRIQNILFIWLDNNINNNSVEYCNTISQLRRTVNDVNVFTDADECTRFIDNTTDVKVCMAIRDSFAQDIVPRVHSMSQVDSIFIICDDKECYKQWAKDWFKIKGIFTHISSVYESLTQVANQCEQNVISVSFVETNDNDVAQKNLDQLDPIFMYSQILKEILLTIEFNDEHIKEYINHCRTAFSENHVQLKKVKKLQTEYHEKTPIWWYTWDSFLYPMLNYALRLMDMNILIKMGFFIKDLHHHIEQLHSKQFSDNNSRQTFIVYRGQGMSTTDFNQMKKAKGGLMSFNNFLSTSKNRQISLDFAHRALSNMEMIGILFVMTIDPIKSTTPFASIVDVGYYGDREDEVLFSMHTVFRIDKITSINESERLFQVNLTLTSDNDKHLRVLTDRIREEINPDGEEWARLGLLLIKMGESGKAEQLYEALLEQTTDEVEKGHIFHLLGCTKDNQGEYEEAISLYEKVLEIKKRTLPPTDLTLALTNNNIGLVYSNMGDYLKALSYYEKAIQIQQQSLPAGNFDLGGSYNNVGLAYFYMGDYLKALSYHEKHLKILKKLFPSNHPRFGACYNNIALVYDSMGDYIKALSYYEKAIENRQQSLPSNHPALAGSYNNIGTVYSQMNDNSKALLYYEKASEISQQLLPPNHPDLASSYGNIGTAYKNMGDYSKALSFHKKALNIWKQSLPSNHPSLASCYSNIGTVYNMMGNYSKALLYYEKDLKILKKVLPSNHPDLGISYNNIAIVYERTNDYTKALTNYEKALEVKQKSLPSSHPSLATSYYNIGGMYCEMNDYPKALLYNEKALEIRQQSSHSNPFDLASSYNNIGDVYRKMGDYSKARSFYEQSVKIGQNSLPTNHPELQRWKTNLDSMKNIL